MASVNDVESVVVEYLHSALSSSKRVEEALRHYIEQLSDEARGRVLPGWKRPTTKSRQIEKPCKPYNPSVGDIERDALAYLNEKQRERALHDENLKATVSPGLVLGAVAALRSGLSWNNHKDNKIENLWAAEECAITSQRFKRSSPVERLVILHDSSVSTAFGSEYKRRITALLIQHELKQNRKSASNAATGQVQRLRKLSRKSTANAQAVSVCANSWLKFIEAWGFGGLVLPGPGHQRSFESGLSFDNFKDLWDFCDQKLPDITARVRQTHETVRRLLDRAIQICEGDDKTLRTGQSRLANAYRTHLGNRKDDTSAASSIVTTPSVDFTPTVTVDAGRTPLETLAELADSRLSDEYIERQPGGTDLVSPSGVTGTPNDGMTNALIQTPAPNQGSASNAGVFSEGMATGRVRASGPPEAVVNPTALYGQAVQPQQQVYTEQSHSQQTVPQHDSLYGAQSNQQYGLGHAGMTTGEQSTPSGWWPAADSRSSNETMAPRFLPDNGMGSTYHSTVGSGYSFNDEWRRTVEELYVQHGDGTSYP